MKASRELDALIAEHVMGYKWSLYDPGGGDEPFEAWVDTKGQPWSIDELNYYTEISAAWEVVEKIISEKNLKLELRYSDKFMADGFFCTAHFATHGITKYYEGSSFKKETAPHAIALASLKVVGYKGDDDES